MAHEERKLSSKKQEAGIPFRNVLARDIRDMRKLSGSTYNEGMLDLVRHYRENAPYLMAKP